MGSRVSLANKCLAIFGCAIVVIIASTLAVPWARSSALVHDYQIEVSQQLTDLWLIGQMQELDEEDTGVTIQLEMLTDITTGDNTFAERARNVFNKTTINPKNISPKRMTTTNRTFFNLPDQ